MKKKETKYILETASQHHVNKVFPISSAVSLRPVMWPFYCLLNPVSAESHLCCFQSPTVSSRAARNSLVRMEVPFVTAFLVSSGFGFYSFVFRIHLSERNWKSGG